LYRKTPIEKANMEVWSENVKSAFMKLV
jgi:hypothetical protein